jgi:hypothetical protein
MKCIHCDCGWITMHEKDEPEPDKCKACGKPGEITVHRGSDVACMIMTISEKRSERINEHAHKHDLMLYQLSKNRWVIVTAPVVSTVKYKDGQARAFRNLGPVCGPADWQTVMKYMKENSPPLPDYLISKD